MGFLLVSLAVVFAAGPAVLTYLLRAEWRAGAPRVNALLAGASLQILLGVWCLGTLGLVFAIEPWVERQGDEALSRATVTAARVAAVCAILWVPAAVVVLVLAVKSLQRKELERLQIPLVAVVFYGTALIWSALWLIG